MGPGFFHFFNRRRSEDMTIQNLPWLNSPSIWLHILKYIHPKTGRLDPEGLKLPDEEHRTLNIRMNWAAGALEGVFGHHTGVNKNPELAHRITALVIKIAQEDSSQAKIDLYKLLLQDDLLTYIDLVIREYMESPIDPRRYLFPFITFLLHEAPDRGPVKFAIAFLGIFKDESEIETISILGRHEEFTLYAAVALSNIMKEPEPHLWKLAKLVDGWGRIHLVERLAGTDDPQIKDWLLREGFRNRIMNEYLAYACAVGGNLRAALDQEIVDDDLLLSAGEIIEALINGGPADDIDDYKDGPVVLNAYLHHLSRGSNRLEHYCCTQAIYRYIKDDLKESSLRSEKGWDQTLFDQVLNNAWRILNQPGWKSIVEAELDSLDESRFELANQVAGALGIDTWGRRWLRLTAHPLSVFYWNAAMHEINQEQMEQVIQFALDELPNRVTLSAAKKWPIPQEVYDCLNCVLHKLGSFPGMGWPLIAAGLKSPMVSNRNKAIQTLGQWGRANWSDEMWQALMEAYDVEPLEKVKEYLKKVLQGEISE